MCVVTWSPNDVNIDIQFVAYLHVHVHIFVHFSYVLLIVHLNQRIVAIQASVVDRLYSYFIYRMYRWGND